jgi:hypothetical protein
MNPYYPKYTKKDCYQTRYYKNKGNYYQRRNGFQKNNNYWNYNNYKKVNYEDKYEEEYTYNKETNESSFSMSTHSNSRTNSYCENNNDNSEINKNNYNNNLNKGKQNNEIVPKIHLSENVIKSAYFVPKSYKDNKDIKDNKKNKENKEDKNITKTEDNINKIEKKDENIVILAINIKISKDKTLSFELRKYDDMFLVIGNFCKENKLNENIKKFLPRTIMKALNSIYGIMNLKLTKEEIAFINELRENYL